MIDVWETSTHLQEFPHAIIHVDGDAFFASCEVALHPELRGRPVITGKERGIASSLSYEAKACGVRRGMILSEIKKICPSAVILASDYETYSLFSRRMFNIMRRFTSQVEEYGIDEGFAEVTGMRGLHHQSYENMARTIKKTIDEELGLTVSVGLAPTKSLAKIASKWQKPNGFTSVPGHAIKGYLSALPVERVWGIGPNTAKYMFSLGINTAHDFIAKPFDYIATHFNKPFQEMWYELNGVSVWPISVEEKTSYASISKTKTFTPPSQRADYIVAQLIRNLENACIKARRHQLVARRFGIYLRTQQFQSSVLECKLTRATNFPHDLLPHVKKLAQELIRPGVLYRATGIVLADLQTELNIQADLFEQPTKVEKMQRVYTAIDALDSTFGKHTVHLGGSQKTFTQPQRETARRHLNIPRLSIVV